MRKRAERATDEIESKMYRFADDVKLMMADIIEAALSDAADIALADVNLIADCIPRADVLRALVAKWKTYQHPAIAGIATRLNLIDEFNAALEE